MMERAATNLTNGRIHWICILQVPDQLACIIQKTFSMTKTYKLHCQFSIFLVCNTATSDFQMCYFASFGWSRHFCAAWSAAFRRRCQRAGTDGGCRAAQGSSCAPETQAPLDSPQKFTPYGSESCSFTGQNWRKEAETFYYIFWKGRWRFKSTSQVFCHQISPTNSKNSQICGLVDSEHICPLPYLRAIETNACHRGWPARSKAAAPHHVAHSELQLKPGSADRWSQQCQWPISIHLDTVSLFHLFKDSDNNS